MFACYSYNFYFGGIFVRDNVQNDIRGRSYESGDIMAIFFGILFGVFTLGMGGPYIKAVTEGKIAGAMAFEVLDRKPAI